MNWGDNEGNKFWDLIIKEGEICDFAAPMQRVYEDKGKKVISRKKATRG